MFLIYGFIIERELENFCDNVTFFQIYFAQGFRLYKRRKVCYDKKKQEDRV